MRALLLAALVAAPTFAQADADSLASAPLASAAPRVVSMFSALRAHQPGDLLTVRLEERTSARRSSESSASASSDLAGAASAGGVFGFDAAVAGRRDSDSRTVQSDLLTGTLTARVVEVDAVGNLVVEGERRLTVDGATHRMTVRGLVRPADVGPQNTVFSYQIAGADVVYEQEGSSGFLSARFLTKVATVVVVAAAVVVGVMAGGGAVADVAGEVAEALPETE